MADENETSKIGRIIKHQRITLSLTLSDLSIRSGVSASHLGRIEREERFPSARALRKIAIPLGLHENDLFVFAGYLAPRSSDTDENSAFTNWDPYAAGVLSDEPAETQRAIIGILAVLKTIAQVTVNR
jgi:transcriptional regulator with XRE-family HTH domain